MSSSVTEITLTGDHNLCAKCGKYRRAHDIIGKCPGNKYGYFQSKYDHDGKLEVEDTSDPVCPYCGEKEPEWWDFGAGNLNSDGDTIRITCRDCEKEFEIEINITYSFDTRKIDHEKEEEEEEERKERHKELMTKKKALMAKFIPGMRIRVNDSSYTIYKGREGVVDNKEQNRHCFVNVILDPNEEGKKAFKDFFDPEELEII